MNLSRRKFFTLAGTSALGVTMVSPLEAFYARVANGQVALVPGYGALQPKLPENAAQLQGIVLSGINLGTTPLVKLPPGFKYNALSFTGQTMDDGTPVRGGHDGMAAFPGPNNTIIVVRNHELSPSNSTGINVTPRYDQIGGGTTTVVINSNRQVVKHFVSLAGTIRNCAGGPTPWGSWISCEEDLTLTPKKHGYNFEVPATTDIQVANPVPLVAMGRFNHEAVAIDPVSGWVYQTEDDGNSCFYRFRPNQKGNLQSGGVLEALVIEGKPTVNTAKNFLQFKNQPLPVTWVQIDNVDPATNSAAQSVRVQGQNKGAAIFARGEGAWFGRGLIYFTCTSGGQASQGQVFAYKPNNNDPTKGTLTMVVESTASTQLNNPDNITVAPFRDIFMCEDGSSTQFVVGIDSKGGLYQFAENAINTSEFAGACFSPDSNTLFVNIQTPGITLAIWGPWGTKQA